MPDDFDALVADAHQTAQGQKGWDFSYVKGRRHTDAVSWSFQEKVYGHLDGVRDMLDMDTGGGESLLELRKNAKIWPECVCATEGYQPNVEVARRNLCPISTEVHEFENYDKLPFDDETFDLITNRHGGYSAHELMRLLRPGGIFITQQIGFANKTSFGSLLDGPEPEYPPVRLEDTLPDFKNAGFDIVEKQEFLGRDIFDDIGAVVFVLIKAPWELPGFSVEKYRDRLYDLHRAIKSNGPIDTGITFFLLIVRKSL